jgi:hypothetical protein
MQSGVQRADSARRETFSSAEVSNHLARLQARLPSGFAVLWQPPFAVIGDEPPATVRRRATDTVKWAVDRLRKDYFARDPQPIMDLWLFKDKASYEKHARELFGDRPTTPFGYYSPKHNALIMNIATGGGTLVHEIVHPFMHANFPQCPPWFNEGLGSLYEQCGDRDGRIWGYPNWRLPALQEAIRAGRLISFSKLLAMDSSQFYGGTDNPNYNQHYAQSRYLCYYLQEQGLLVRFYREFVAQAKADPTGEKTLKQVLRTDDLQAFQKKWETFVLGLRQREGRWLAGPPSHSSFAAFRTLAVGLGAALARISHHQVNWTTQRSERGCPHPRDPRVTRAISVGGSRG